MRHTSLAMAMALAGTGFAGTAQAAATPTGLTVEAALLDYHYDERLDGDPIIRDDGTMAGLGLGYVLGIGRGNFLRAKLDVAGGRIDYREIGAETRLDDVPQAVGALEFHFGHDFAAGGNATVTPFIGFGARHLSDGSGGRTSDDGFYGYDREISYQYVPVGLAFRQSAGRGLTFAAGGQFNWLVGGEVESRFSDVDAQLPDIKLDIDKGHGLEFSAQLEMPVRGGRSAITFGPFVRHWNVDRSESYIIEDPDSDEAIEIYEPRSRTTTWGARLGFRF